MSISVSQMKSFCTRLKCAKRRYNMTNSMAIDHLRFVSTKKNKKNTILQILILVIGGAIVGMVNGFFGGGGGMVCVPILEKFLTLESKSAHAGAIAVIFPLSLVSGIVYIINGYISSFPLLLVSIGVVIGGIIGAFLLKFLPSKIIKIMFLIIMFLGGIKLILWII